MSGYYITKRPGQRAKIVKNPGAVVEYETIQDATDHCFFTMTQIQVKGRLLDVYCDDEGLLKNLPMCFWHQRQQQPIVGPILVCDHDGEGESIPLDKEMAEATAQWLDGVGPSRN